MEPTLPGVQQGLPAAGVFNLLRRDARVFAEIITVPQAAVAQGVTEAELTGDVAMWEGSPEWNERQRRAKHEALERKRQWGRYPA